MRFTTCCKAGGDPDCYGCVPNVRTLESVEITDWADPLQWLLPLEVAYGPQTIRTRVLNPGAPVETSERWDFEGFIEREDVTHVREGLVMNLTNASATGDRGKWFGSVDCGVVNYHGQQKGTQIQPGFYEHNLGPFVFFECVDWQPLQIYQKDHNPEFNDQYHGLLPLFPSDYTDVGGGPCNSVDPRYVCTRDDTLRFVRTWLYPHPVTKRWVFQVNIRTYYAYIWRKFTIRNVTPGAPYGFRTPPDVWVECGSWYRTMEGSATVTPFDQWFFDNNNPDNDYSAVEDAFSNADTLTYDAAIDCVNHFQDGGVITLDLVDTISNGAVATGKLSAPPAQIQLTVSYN